MTVRFAPRSGVSVGRLHAQEIGAAIGLLSRAFLADPILTCYFRGARRPLAFRLLFGDLVLAIARSGTSTRCATPTAF